MSLVKVESLILLYHKSVENELPPDTQWSPLRLIDLTLIEVHLFYEKLVKHLPERLLKFQLTN